MLVFDLGGGTLDISIVDICDNVYEVLCIEGDSKLGGEDFDQIIINYILENIHKEYGVTIEQDPIKELILKEAAEIIVKKMYKDQKITEIQKAVVIKSAGSDKDNIFDLVCLNKLINGKENLNCSRGILGSWSDLQRGGFSHNY